MQSNSLKQKMDQTKDQVLNRVLIVILFFMVIGISVSLLRVAQTGFLLIYGVQIFMALLMVLLFIFQSKLSTKLKGAVFLTALYGMGLSGLLSFGLYGFGYAYFIPASAIAFLFFSRRVGWVITTSSLMLLVLIAYLFSENIFYFRPENPYYMETFAIWVNMIITVLLIAIVITLFWNNLYGMLSNTFTHIHYQQEDMTKMNNDLIAARDKALQSDRLKSSFLQNISHEIRTPLNIIIGFSDMVSQTNDPVEHLEFNKVIRENSNLMLKIVNDIVDFSKIETNTLSINKTSFNIKDVISEIEKSLHIDDSKSIKIDIEKIDYQLMTDRSRVYQIIENLLDNAIRFTNEGSIQLVCSNGNDNLIFQIIDTGIGIDKEEQEKIFDRFYKVDAFSGGAGLGLSLSKSIANYLGGDISVSSIYGEGSTFKFTLPISN